jgi:hypothetical protein
MGLKPKELVDAAAEDGIKLSHRRASEIINGQTPIRPNEMEVISKLTNKTVDDLYMDLGSVLEASCPLMSIGAKSLVACCRQQCAWWNWTLQVCTVKTLEGVITKQLGGDTNV